MTKQKKPLFVSLYWKSTSGLALILLALISFFTLFNVEQLKELQQQQRVASQQQHIVEYEGLLKKSALQLTNLVDGLPNLTSDRKSLQSKINKHWLSLQITWGLESATLIDGSGQIIQQWGDKRIFPSGATVQRVLTSSSPVEEMVCFEHCQLAVSSPALSDSGDVNIIQLSVSLADTLLDFQRATRSDIGILTPTIDGNEYGGLLGNTGLSFSSLTNRTLLQPVVNNFALGKTWKSDFIKPSQQKVFVLDTPAFQYELLFLSNSELVDNRAIVLFMTDTSADREQIKYAQYTYVVTGLLATFISIALVVLVLWRPIRSLQRQSRALPLLAEGKYQEAKGRLQNMARNRLFSDEISQLQDTSLEVTSKLENYHKQLTNKSKKLFEMAHFDPLTSLINRAHLIELVDEKLRSVDEDDRHLALIYLDLDNFKHINDALGHMVGDNLLSIVAGRLKDCVGVRDYAARTGGDEFCLVLNRAHTEKNVIEVAKQVLRALEEPVSVDGRKLAVSSSIGISLSLVDGDTAATLLQNADLAMYQAKSAGKNNYHMFNHQLHKDADSRMALEEELRRAVEHKEFVLYYQPQIDLSTGALLGCEALIRWMHPERGLLAPFFFIDTIESNGLIIPVGKWIIREACRQCAEWRGQGLGDIKMSINLSARQFNDPDLLNDINSAIEEYSISPKQLEFEVTESLLATDIKHAISLLKELQALGLTIAIDDFGTGYSSLNYLKQLPLDKLKVDRAFIMDLPDDNDDKQITAAIIAMAHALNLKVVAEGVETKEQMGFLQEMQCEIGQGYLFNKPLSAEDFAASPLAKDSFTPPSGRIA